MKNWYIEADGYLSLFIALIGMVCIKLYELIKRIGE